MFGTLPPAGNFPSFASVLTELIAGGWEAALAQSDLPGADRRARRYFVGSGREGIQFLCERLPQVKRVVFGGYTCPDIVAAILKAGKVPVACDVDPNSLELLLPELRGGDAVLLANLYGMRDRLPAKRSVETPVIDDCCQLPLATLEPVDQTLHRIWSYGRGKGVSGIGGGAIDSHCFDNDSSIIDRGFLTQVRDLGKLLSYSILSNPLPYSLLDRWVKLGVTEFQPDFSCGSISKVQLAVESVQRAREATLTEGARERVGWWEEELRGQEVVFPHLARGWQGRLIRLPMLIRAQPERLSLLRAEVLRRGRKFGISGSYGQSIDRLCIDQLGGALIETTGELLGAKQVALELVTLPIHQRVDRHWVRAAGEMLRSVL